MVSHTHGRENFERKPNLNLPKTEELAKLKQRLAEAEEKLKKDPENKKLREITNNLKQMFERERDRGYSC